MQSKNHKPTAKQKAWRETVRALGCYNHRGRKAEIHHVVGAAGRQNKVRIGHWFILPLCAECHRTHPEHNVTTWRHRYTETFDSQRVQWLGVCSRLVNQGEEMPFSLDVINAILATNK